ncbi:WYL domain-containing protein [Stieleria varia]|uniref:WYL domain-containing protein n=1 Tax=Stieleria varia TaxID=2528005 RepID=A0A5C6B8Y6_9BACT|nr:hypothetical protein [Stieleria varia]TWU07726.1 hypothetical protein Pla52n_02990 [Stieleria varia]
MKSLLRRAMLDSENYVIEMEYSDSKGNRTRRFVSPIRFVGDYRFLGLCLCREEPRQFQLSRCENVRLIPAVEVMMPMPMAELPAKETSREFNEQSVLAPAMSGAALSGAMMGECLV